MLSPNLSTLDPELYLERHEPPSNFLSVKEELLQFIAKWKDTDKKIAFITSGGTTVPLENQTVRFVDNFSAGTRGATSAEYFLENGYAVIFMHRQFSLQPYSRHFSHTTNCFLDYLDYDSEKNRIQANPSYDSEMKEVLIKYQKSKKEGTLLTISFVTVTDYLFLLTFASQALSGLRGRVLFYLAAAVSDFFIPSELMAEHKIQSSDGDLNIAMKKVPKFLKPLVTKWAPQAFIVSFKLETDPKMLIPKAQQSLTQYGHQLVVGNLLATRKSEVWFIYPQLDKEPKHIEMVEKEDIKEIEYVFLPKLQKEHEIFIHNQKYLS